MMAEKLKNTKNLFPKRKNVTDMLTYLQAEELRKQSRESRKYFREKTRRMNNENKK